MAATWIAHVKETHKKNGGSYKDALKAASKTWKKKGAAAAKPAKKGRKKAAEEVDEKEEEAPAAPAPKRRRRKATQKSARPGPRKGYRGINTWYHVSSALRRRFGTAALLDPPILHGGSETTVTVHPNTTRSAAPNRHLQSASCRLIEATKSSLPKSSRPWP